MFNLISKCQNEVEGLEHWIGFTYFTFGNLSLMALIKKTKTNIQMNTNKQAAAAEHWLGSQMGRNFMNKQIQQKKTANTDDVFLRHQSLSSYLKCPGWFIFFFFFNSIVQQHTHVWTTQNKFSLQLFALVYAKILVCIYWCIWQELSDCHVRAELKGLPSGFHERLDRQRERMKCCERGAVPENHPQPKGAAQHAALHNVQWLPWVIIATL